MFSQKTLIAACGFASAVSAHMIMGSPPPFTSPAVHNGPLAADGSDFPCQMIAGGSYAGAATQMALGSKQPLTFIGQATHGGGSCQVSITYDTNPTKNSVWKVVHSIEGGCPAQNTAGNMGNDASAADPFTYSFPIPDNIPTGNATIAWTWLNKIGNREFYMNCGAVVLTGTSGDEANYNALPDMLVANIGNGCTTEEGFDYTYPSPGDSVEKLGTGPYTTPQGNCGATGSGSGSDSGSSPTTAAAAAPSTSAGLPGGVFVTVSSAAAATTPVVASTPVATTPVASVPVASSPAAAASSAVASAAPSSGSGSDSGSGQTVGAGTGGLETPGSACSPEGLWNCMGTQFQQCGSGVWSVAQSLAAGTSCTVGQSAAIDITASSGKKKRVAVRFRG